jgi:penicillin-insensitive murein endopeptidase
MTKSTLGLLAWALAACGPATVIRQPGFDEMHFAEDEAMDDWGPTDSAVVAIRRPPPRPKSPRIAGVPAAEVPSVPVPLPGPRCDNRKEAPSRSLGSTTDGGLQDGCKIPAQGPGWVAVNKNAWATDEVVALLQWATAQVAARFAGQAPLVVGALSRETGGTLKPHRSHQAGRDVDLGYFQLNGRPPHFFAADASNLDLERTWALLELLLYSGDVAFVFMDYELQALFHDALLDNGWTEDALGQIFQYPAGPAVPRGLIRHAQGHRDHFHVRFRCAQKDLAECRD